MEWTVPGVGDCTIKVTGWLLPVFLLAAACMAGGGLAIFNVYHG